jgi:hypothetical protein
VVTAVEGKAREAVEQYREGKLSEAGEANVPERFGMERNSG